MKDGRGEHKVIQGRDTLERVRAILIERPELNKGEICKELGIGRITLRKHLLALGKI